MVPGGTSMTLVFERDALDRVTRGARVVHYPAGRLAEMYDNPIYVQIPVGSNDHRI
jgi:hypothetical protein